MELAQALVRSAAADFGVAATPIDNPDAAYLAATTKIDIAGLPDSSDQTSITDGTLTVTFSEPLNKRGPVPDGWLTWSSPPFSEDPNPYVLVASTGSLEMTLSRPVSIFGFELEPGPFAPIEFTADFYRGNDLVESITRVVDGNAGARLFAREDGVIDRVVITGGSDFAIAQVRYQLPTFEDEVFIIVVALLIILLLVLLLL